MKGTVTGKASARQLIRFYGTLEIRENPEDPDASQKREHWVAVMYRNFSGLRSLRDLQLGDSFTVNQISFAPGAAGGLVTLPKVLDDDGAEVPWLVTGDDLSQENPKVNQWRNTLTVETYSTWVTYTPFAFAE